MTLQSFNGRQPAASLPSPLGRGRSILRWLERWRERQTLRDLNDAVLRDVGLTRADVEHEINRPFWMV